MSQLKRTLPVCDVAMQVRHGIYKHKNPDLIWVLYCV